MTEFCKEDKTIKNDRAIILCCAGVDLLTSHCHFIVLDIENSFLIDVQFVRDF